MFSKFIRLGALISSAVILSSCGGGTGQTETQQSTPEGLFNGIASLYINSTGIASATAKTISGGPGVACTENVLMFVNYGGTFYSFFSIPNPKGTLQTDKTIQPYVVSASSGQLTFSGGTMNSANVIQVTPQPNIVLSPTPAPAPDPYEYCGVPTISSTSTNSNASQVVNNQVAFSTFTGAYTTGTTVGGTYSFPSVIDAQGDFETETAFNLNYNTGYQGIQNLATLAGTYVGTVGTSRFSESATFVFSPATVPANGDNQFGVSTVTGTGASGCTYTGTASPLFKGNAYSVVLTTGGSPCTLATAQYQGLVYLDTINNFLYSFSVNGAHTDGLIFTGAR